LVWSPDIAARMMPLRPSTSKDGSNTVGDPVGDTVGAEVRTVGDAVGAAVVTVGAVDVPVTVGDTVGDTVVTVGADVVTVGETVGDTVVTVGAEVVTVGACDGEASVSVTLTCVPDPPVASGTEPLAAPRLPIIAHGER